MNYFNAVWRSHRSKLALSVFCVAIAFFDTFWKALSPIAAGALAIAIVPWVLQFIEKISAPGGFEVVIAKAERQLDESHKEPEQADLEAFKYFESSDPNLAIAMLRVQVERRLRQIAEDVMLEPSKFGRPRTMRMLAEDLASKGAISKEAANLLRDLTPVLNEAVHGVELQSNASEFALVYGPRILALLRPDEAV